MEEAHQSFLPDAVPEQEAQQEAQPEAQHEALVPVPKTGTRGPARAARGVDPAPGCAGEPLPSPYAQLHQRTLLALAQPSVLVDVAGAIVHASEHAGAFLRYGGGEPSAQLLTLVLPELRACLHAAMLEVQASGAAVRCAPVRTVQGGRACAVGLTVTPVQDSAAGQGMLLVQFGLAVTAPAADGDDADARVLDPRVHELEQALQEAQQYLQRTLERAEASDARLRKANDALLGTVDQLRASIVELEVEREERQSRGEEMHTVNADLRIRVEETNRVNDDLSNLIASTDIATLFLDHQLRIHRYTPYVTDIFHVIEADVGRPLAHIASRLGNTSLLDDAAGVLADLAPVERELRSNDGRDYIVRINPYRTAYERVEGVVLTFFDITKRRSAEKALRDSEQRLALAFATLPVGIGTVDTDGSLVLFNEVMQRFLPNGVVPSRDPAQLPRWRAWDAAGAPVRPEDFPAARALRGESALHGMQMLYLDDAGRETWTEVRAEPLRDSDGSITGALVALIDVDRLKRGEEEAQRDAQRQAFLLELSDVLRAERDADAMAGHAVGMLAEALRLDRCCSVAWRAGEDGAGRSRQAGNGRVPALPDTLRLADCPPALRGALEQTLAVENDFGHADVAQAVRQSSERLGLRALVAATLRDADNAPAWSLLAMCADARDWTRGEAALFEEVAVRTASAIERARAEAMAERAERRAESILEHMGDAHSVLDRDYRIVGVNAAAERLLGIPRAMLLGRSHWDAFPASVDAPVGRAFRRVVEEGVEQHLTHHYSGEGHDLHLEVDAYPTEEGGLAMFWRDVTERVQAELALRASEEKYRALFNRMDEAYAVVEVIADTAGEWQDFLFLEVNPAFMRHTGMPYPVGRTATQILGTPNPRWAQLYGRAAQSGESIRLEEAEVALGRVFDLNIFRLDGEGSRRVAVLFTDITERKLTEGALRESEARFRALTDASPALIWQVDADGALDYVNGRWRDLVGAGLEQLRGRGWHAAVHPDDVDACLEAVARSLRERQSMQQRLRLRLANGGFHWFESHARPWYAADGRLRGLVGISIDVDEAVCAEQALRTADRRKDEFLATLAHELRNPLAPISNALQFLRFDGGRRRADRMLAMVERQVRHMVRLVDDLMEVTRISRGKVDLRRSPVTLAEVLDSALETSLPGFEGKRQQLALDFKGEVLVLDADKVRLTQVFSNLLNNAARYTHEGGQVWLAARREGSDAVVTVRDTGMGIPQDQLARIFEMFAQPHASNGHSASGLGIGLSMVRSLVELHGGAVAAHSAGPGQGSKFVVRLPLCQRRNSAPQTPGDALGADPLLLAGRRILVVDDNRDAADSLCQLLAQRGAETRALYDGRAALDAVALIPPHAIVLDIGMPDMDGCEVARRIRQGPEGAAIQLIALSGWGQHADRQRSRESGFDHHLTKPAEMEGLLRLLAAQH